MAVCGAPAHNPHVFIVNGFTFDSYIIIYNIKPVFYLNIGFLTINRLNSYSTDPTENRVPFWHHCSGGALPLREKRSGY